MPRTIFIGRVWTSALTSQAGDVDSAAAASVTKAEHASDPDQCRPTHGLTDSADGVLVHECFLWFANAYFCKHQ